jgi:hypothetical protein
MLAITRVMPTVRVYFFCSAIYQITSQKDDYKLAERQFDSGGLDLFWG